MALRGDIHTVLRRRRRDSVRLRTGAIQDSHVEFIYYQQYLLYGSTNSTSATIIQEYPRLHTCLIERAPDE